MRTLFGVILGIAITVGAAALHDNNLSYDPNNPNLANQQIVNWPVFNAVIRQMTDTIGTIWNNLTRKA